MTQRAKKGKGGRPRKSTGQRKQNKGPAPLLVIDQTPIVKRWLATCRRLRTELHKKQSLLQTFEEEKLAQFSQWQNATFGEKFTRIRSLEEERMQWRMIGHHLECCEFTLPHRVEEIYRELIERKEAGTLAEFVPPIMREGDPDFEPRSEEEESDGGFEEDEDFENEEEEDFVDMDDDVWEDLEAEMDAFFEEVGEENREKFSSVFEEFRRQRSAVRGKGGKTPEELALKAQYRMLAKRLHPDHSELPKEVRERRWFELQEAYEQRDRAAMERIEAVCDMDSHGLSASLGLARLKELATYHQRHLRPLRNALREAKKHPAFSFDRQNSSSLKREIGRSLEFRISDLEDECRALQDELKRDYENGFRGRTFIGGDFDGDDWDDEDEDFEDEDFEDDFDEEHADSGFDDIFLTPEKLAREEREMQERYARERQAGGGR